jgi:glycosyltransferase involved in cell wall biosynthesis
VGSGWQFVSGISYYTWRLATALREGGMNVSAVLMRNLLPKRLYPGHDRVGSAVSNQEYPEGMPVFNGVDWWGLPSLWRAARFLREQKPEVVVFQWWTSTVLHSYLALALVAKANGAKVVIEFHEVLDSAELRVPFVQTYARAVGRRILKRTDGALLHSQYDLELLHSNYPMLADIPAVVAPLGPFDHLMGEPQAADETPVDEACNLLFFGTIRPYKGLEYLIQAFDSLTAQEAADFHLTVIGEVWEGWTLPTELIEASPYRDRITFVPRYVDDSEAAAAFQRADAVVLPYLRSSASGPLHLAMSHGLPVAITSVGGLQEAAGDYEGVVFVPPADAGALRECLFKLRDRKGSRYADPHSWSRTLNAIQDLAQRMGAGSSPADALDGQRVEARA